MPPSRAVQRDVAARRARALQLYAAGATYQAIADTLGLKSRNHAVIDVRRALTERQADLSAGADLLVALEVERLDSLQRAGETVLANATRDRDPWMQLRAIDRLTRLSWRRATLLGLDAAEPSGGDRGERPEDVVDEVAARRARRRAAAHR